MLKSRLQKYSGGLKYNNLKENISHLIERILIGYYKNIIKVLIVGKRNMSQRIKPVKILRKCINKMSVLNVQRCKPRFLISRRHKKKFDLFFLSYVFNNKTQHKTKWKCLLELLLRVDLLLLRS